MLKMMRKTEGRWSCRYRPTCFGEDLESRKRRKDGNMAKGRFAGLKLDDDGVKSEGHKGKQYMSTSRTLSGVRPAAARLLLVRLGKMLLTKQKDRTS